MPPSSAAIQAGRAFVRIGGDNTELRAALLAAKGEMKKWAADMDSLGNRLIAVGAAMVIPIGLAMARFKEFDDEIRYVGAVTRASGKDLEMLRDKARLLGRTMSFTATQVASAMAELGKGGFSPKETDQSIGAVMDLARATRTDIPTASEIAVNALRVFRMEASRMDEVSDILVTVANASTTDVIELGEALEYSSANAYLWGESLESTAKALGVLANLGLKGSMAGTALNQVFVQLSDPLVVARLQSMGVAIETITAAGQRVPRAVGDILADVGIAMSRLPRLEQLSLGKELFNVRGARAGLRFTNAETEIRALNAAMSGMNGVSRRTAQEMDAGFGGAVRRVIASLESMALSIGDALGPALTKLALQIRDIEQRLSEWIHLTPRAIDGALKFGVAILSLGVAFKVFAAAVTASSVLLAANPVAIVLGVIALATAAVTAAWIESTLTAKTYGEAILSLTNRITGLSNAYSDLNAKQERSKKLLAESQPGTPGTPENLPVLQQARSEMLDELATAEKRIGKARNRLREGTATPRWGTPSVGYQERKALEQEIRDAMSLAATLRVRLDELDAKINKARQSGARGQPAAPQNRDPAAQAEMMRQIRERFIKENADLYKSLAAAQIEGGPGGKTKDLAMADLEHQAAMIKIGGEGGLEGAWKRELERRRWLQDRANIEARYREKAAEDERRAIESINALRIRATMRGFNEEVALLNNRYDAERDRILANKDIDAAERGRQIARNEEERRAAIEAAKSNKTESDEENRVGLELDLARQQVENNLSLSKQQKELALLELDRKEALRKNTKGVAGGAQDQSELINSLFRAKGLAISQSTAEAPQSRGTFSASELGRMGGSSSYQQLTAKNTKMTYDEIRAMKKELAGIMKNLRQMAWAN